MVGCVFVCRRSAEILMYAVVVVVDVVVLDARNRKLDTPKHTSSVPAPSSQI